MKTRRTTTGPFSERPFCSDEEIERICSDALIEMGFMPDRPEAVRIDRFIEKRFKAPIIFEPLAASVLGFTEFGPNGVEAVHVAEPPSNERSVAAERRVNSTLAHEAGHGLMHAHLFALEADRAQLFENDPDVTETKVLCRDGVDVVPRGPKRRYDGRWWELQANRAIGALLMPKALFLVFVEPFLEARGTIGVPQLVADRRTEAVRAAAELFDVNPAAAKVRVDLLLPDEGGQLTL